MKINSINQIGLYANRPSFGIAGRLYFATDQNKTYYDTGSAWSELNPTIAARYTTNAGQSFSNGTPTIINFEDKDYDTHDAVTIGASWKFTAPFAGYYSVKVSVLLDTSSDWAALEPGWIAIYRDGTLYSYLARSTAIAANQYLDIVGSDNVYIALGSYIDIRLNQDSGGAIALNTTAQLNHVSIHGIA